jgi:hypothetical protein
LVKRVGVHLVDDTDGFLTHFDVFDQGTKDRTTCVPIRFTQTFTHTLCERFQLLHRSREICFFRLPFRRGCRFAFQPRQTFTGLTDAWFELTFLQ